MYSRNYYPEATEKISLPENYDGTAFIERSAEEPTNEILFDPAEEPTLEASSRNDGLLSGFGEIPILSALFGSHGGSGKLKMPSIGIEEILILATAAFLFFSKDGDKESALILLLLLLIN